jgi:hypothetical protein
MRYRIKGDKDEEIKRQACAALPYLQACIEEVLQLFPAAPVGASRQMAEGSGYIIPVRKGKAKSPLTQRPLFRDVSSSTEKLSSRLWQKYLNGRLIVRR